MRKLMMLLVTGLMLWAVNPTAFSGLGDPIYDAVPQFEQLAQTKTFAAQQETIAAYLAECNATKQAGLALEQRKHEDQEIKNYLNRLRALNTAYEGWIGRIYAALDRAITTNDYESFTEMIQSGFVDIEKRPDQIVTYYAEHNATAPISEIDDYIAYQAKLEAIKAQEATEKKEAQRALYNAYRQQRIDQVNRRISKKKAAYREAVEEETEEKKEQVHRTQEEELGIK